MVYVNNLFDENALLSFDRERGGRARLGFNIGQPRIDRRHAPEALRQLSRDRTCRMTGMQPPLPCSSPGRARRRPPSLPASRSARSRRRARWDVVVVGAGVFGAWTAKKLQEAGQRVAAARRLGAGPCPRLLGRGIADDPRRLRRRRGLYPDGAANSLTDWRALSARAGPADLPRDRRAVLLPAGRALSSSRRCAVHRRLGLPTELLDGAAMRRRFPQIDFTGVAAGLYEPGFGALMARRAVQTLVAEFVRAGGDLSPGADPRRRRRRAPLCPRSPPPTASAIAGRALRLRLRPLARPGLPRPARPPHLPDPAGGVLLRARRRATTRFEPGRLPGWADFNGGDIYYGFPDLEGRGFKIAHDAHGAADGPGHRRPHALGQRARRRPRLHGPPLPATGRPAAERGARLPI